MIKPITGIRLIASQNTCLVSEYLPKTRPTGLNAYVELNKKLLEAEKMLGQYLPRQKVKMELTRVIDDLQVENKTNLTILELIEFHRLLERSLAGSIGAAAAHHAFIGTIRYTDRKARELKTVYDHILSELLTTPQELEKQIQHAKKPSEFDTASDQLQAKLLEREAKIQEQETIMHEMQQKIERLAEKSDPFETSPKQKKKKPSTDESNGGDDKQ